MIQIDLIRHGATRGNAEKRYIGGRTDEDLSAEGILALKAVTYPKRELLFVSPMKRCIRTADILFPGQEKILVESLRECDFGEFEGKNFKELNGNPAYQEWIDSNGTMPFPGGESREVFRERNLRGFEEAVLQMIKMKTVTASFVVHGGAIMNILEAYGVPRQEFYSYHVDNACGYGVLLEESLWIRGRRELRDISRI